MSDPTQSGQQAPGWYPDPQSGQLRWWDGQQWGQFQQQAGAPAPVAGGGVANPQQTAALAHYLGLIGFIGPLIIYLTSGKQDRYVEDQSVEALNFHLTILIGYVISGVLMLVLIGFLTWIVCVAASVIYSIIGGMAASKGEWYRYPFSIKFVKPSMGGAPV
jgi:hypothetical protein